MQTVAQKLREMEKVLTVKEIAKVLRVSADSVYNLVSTQRIPYIRVGKQIRFDPQIIGNWLERTAYKGSKSGKNYYITEG